MSYPNGFKEQLKRSLSSAVSYFQDGGDPNEACTKAANDAEFNPDQADRLVEAFNTARVICHYKAASDKAGACSLADKAAVHRGLKAEPKAEKAAEYFTHDYGCYRMEEADYFMPEVKVAFARPAEAGLSREDADWVKFREADTIRDCIKTACDEARAANSLADEMAEKVATALSRNVSIDAVHDKVARLVAGYALDERYAPGVEKVAAFLPEASDPPKVLLKKYAGRHVVDTSDLEEVLPAIKSAADCVAEASALEAYAYELAKEADGATSPTTNTKPGPKPDSQPESLFAGVKSDGSGDKKLTSFFAHVTDLAKEYVDNGAERRINKATDRLNNLRRQIILQDLLVRDKVLSQENPDAVISAFRSIQQASPDTTLNKEIMRSMLRSAVQSVALSPYDVKTLADIDKARRQVYTSSGDSSKGRK